MTNQRSDRALFLSLLLAGLFGSLIGAPWSIAILSDAASVWRSVVVEVLFLLTPASVAGVWLGKKVGLGSRLRDFVSGKPGSRENLRRSLLPAILVGLTLGGITFFAQNAIPKSAFVPSLAIPNIFAWFLRCLSAALTEEIFFRFGLMTLFVWVLRSIIKRPAFNESSLWVGNLLSALAFAGAHLPQLTSQGWSRLIPVVMFSSSAGMVMGWIYMRYGLVSAIVAHFIGDLIVYVVPRLVAGIS